VIVTVPCYYPARRISGAPPPKFHRQDAAL
jgi:hypothetical protein